MLRLPLLKQTNKLCTFDFMKRTTVFTVAAVIIGLLSVSPAQAAGIINGNFGSGLTGWLSYGDVGIKGNYAGGPVSGSVNQAIVTNASSDPSPDSNGNFNLSGNSSVDISTLESDLGLASGTLTPSNAIFGPVNGSALTQSFTANAGQSLDFTWKFLTNDTTQVDPVNFPGLQDADNAVAILTSGSSQKLFTLADTSSALLSNSTDGSGYLQDTPFESFNYNLPTTGTYSLQFVVINQGNSALTSGLLLNNVNTSFSAVPEPANYLAVALAGTVLVFIKHKSQSKKHMSQSKKYVSN
jgi:hypothetical protein